MRILTLIGLGLFGAAACSFALSAALGVRLNTTASMPIGIYRVAHGPITRGVLVSACLPASNAMTEVMRLRGYEHDGTCVTGLAPLIKPVAAVAGDTVVLTEDSVTVNGKRLPDSATANRDSQGRVLPGWPRGTYHVPKDTVWLVSTYSANSLDSRYFGPLPISSIETSLSKL